MIIEARKLLLQYRVALQPILELSTRAYFGFEALLRGCGLCQQMSPKELLNLADRQELLLFLELDILRQACGAVARMDNQDLLPRVFWNISPGTLKYGNELCDGILGIIKKSGLVPSDVCIEIPEGIAADGRSCLDYASVFQRLSAEGLLIALDDFGTGVSGLKLLYQFEPHFVKIDAFFLQGVAAEEKKQLLLSSILDATSSVGARAIAEGMESPDDVKLALGLGIELQQGHIHGAPTCFPCKCESN